MGLSRTNIETIQFYRKRSLTCANPLSSPSSSNVQVGSHAFSRRKSCAIVYFPRAYADISIMKLNFKGLTFSFTGYFVCQADPNSQQFHVAKKYLKQLLEKKSALFSTQISKKVDFLVEGYKSSRTKKTSRSKIIRAKKYSISTISSDQFLDMLSPAERKWLMVHSGKKSELEEKRAPKVRPLTRLKYNSRKKAA